MRKVKAQLIIVIRLFNKSYSNCKILDDQVRRGGPKSVDSDASAFSHKKSGKILIV